MPKLPTNKEDEAPWHPYNRINKRLIPVDSLSEIESELSSPISITKPLTNDKITKRVETKLEALYKGTIDGKMASMNSGEKKLWQDRLGSTVLRKWWLNRQWEEKRKVAAAKKEASAKVQAEKDRLKESKKVKTKTSIIPEAPKVSKVVEEKVVEKVVEDTEEESSLSESESITDPIEVTFSYFHALRLDIGSWYRVAGSGRPELEVSYSEGSFIFWTIHDNVQYRIILPLNFIARLKVFVDSHHNRTNIIITRSTKPNHEPIFQTALPTLIGIKRVWTTSPVDWTEYQQASHPEVEYSILIHNVTQMSNILSSIAMENGKKWTDKVFVGDWEGEKVSIDQLRVGIQLPELLHYRLGGISSGRIIKVDVLAGGKILALTNWTVEDEVETQVESTGMDRAVLGDITQTRSDGGNPNRSNSQTSTSHSHIYGTRESPSIVNYDMNYLLEQPPRFNHLIPRSNEFPTQFQSTTNSLLLYNHIDASPLDPNRLHSQHRPTTSFESTHTSVNDEFNYSNQESTLDDYYQFPTPLNRSGSRTGTGGGTGGEGDGLGGILGCTPGYLNRMGSLSRGNSRG